MRVLVTGGRDFGDCPRQAPFAARIRAQALRKALWDRLDALQPTEIAQGGARGADRVARAWAAARGVPCRTYRADWERLGKRAGLHRNETMFVDFGPNLVLACPGGRGTHHMVGVALRGGCRVLALDVTDATG